MPERLEAAFLLIYWVFSCCGDKKKKAGNEGNS